MRETVHYLSNEQFRRQSRSVRTLRLPNSKIGGVLSGFRHAGPTGKRMSKRADYRLSLISLRGVVRGSLLWFCAHGTLTELQEVPALSETELLLEHNRAARGVRSRCDVRWCGRRSAALAVIFAENAYIPELLRVFPIDASSPWGRGHECNRRACLDVFVLFGLLEQGLSCTECSRGEDHE